MAAQRRKTAHQDTWPLGKYLVAARGKMSIREAARRANISESRWRQVEAGFQRMAGGIEVPVHPKAETVAAMCRAISADVRKGLQLAGHDPDHYAWLLEPAMEAMPDDVRHTWFAQLSREERERVLAELQRLHVDTEVEQRRRAV